MSDVNAAAHPVAGSTANFYYIANDILLAAIYPLIAWACWNKAPRLAMRLTRGVSSEGLEHSSGLRPRDLLSIVIVAIGLYQFSEALPRLGTLIQSDRRVIHNLSQLPWDVLAPALIRLAVGFWFVFGNSGIVAYLQREDRVLPTTPDDQ